MFAQVFAIITLFMESTQNLWRNVHGVLFLNSLPPVVTIIISVKFPWRDSPGDCYLPRGMSENARKFPTL